MQRHATVLAYSKAGVRVLASPHPVGVVRLARGVRVGAPESLAGQRTAVDGQVGPPLVLASTRRRTFRAFHARAFWPCFAGAFALTLASTVVCLGGLHGQGGLVAFLWMLPLVLGPFGGLGLLYQRGWFRALVTVTDNGILVRTPITAAVHLPLPLDSARLHVADSESCEGARRLVLELVSAGARTRLGFQTGHSPDLSCLCRLVTARSGRRLAIPIEMEPNELTELARRVLPPQTLS